MPRIAFEPPTDTTTAQEAWRLLLPRGRHLELTAGRPRILAVLNLTPDSFSDGGRFVDPDRAVERGLELLAEGADFLDLGAESTRPGGGVYGEGAADVSVDLELSRLLPTLERLRKATEAPISVDTRKGAVARAALGAGADLINDVSALGDPDLGAAVAEAGCPLILMHSRGDLPTMQRSIHFVDVAQEVASELAMSVAKAEMAGIAAQQTIVDPGVGFGKTAEQNFELIERLEELQSLGRPILVGASRKSFLATVSPAPADQRLPGSLAAIGRAAARGAAIVRVHDVRETVAYLKVQAAFDAAARRRG